MGRLTMLSRKSPIIMTNDITDLVGEDGCIVEKALYPVHQRVHVLGCRKLRGAFVFDPILPEILVSVDHGVRLG